MRSSEGDELRRRLWENTNYFRSGLIDAGFDVKGTSSIVAVHADSACSAFHLVKALRSKGVFTPAVTYPAVPRDDSRLRFTISAHHEREDLDQAIKALIEVKSENVQSAERPLDPGETTSDSAASNSKKWQFLKEKLSKTAASAQWRLGLKADSFEVTDRSTEAGVVFVDRNGRSSAPNIEANELLSAVLRREIDVFGSLDLLADVLAAAS